MNCPHGRETPKICPHCLGLNTTPASERIQEIVERNGRPRLEDFSRVEMFNLLGKIAEQCSYALKELDRHEGEDAVAVVGAWLRTIRRTALQREDV